MFLKDKQSGDLILIEHLEELFDPFAATVSGKDQAGKEEQDSAIYAKEQLVFPSGEELPRCWIDANYPRE